MIQSSGFISYFHTFFSPSAYPCQVAGAAVCSSLCPCASTFVPSDEDLLDAWCHCSEAQDEIKAGGLVHKRGHHTLLSGIFVCFVVIFSFYS